MALPVVAAFIGKGMAVIKGVSAAKLAKVGITVIPARQLAKRMSLKERKAVEKESKKKGIKIDFSIDGDINTKFKINNKNRTSRFVEARSSNKKTSKHKTSKLKRSHKKSKNKKWR